MDTKNAVAALSALAQQSRLAVFRWLVERGPEGAFPGELTERLEIPPATLSFHLKNLLHAGMVEAEQQGRHIRYRANFPRMQDLLAFLSQNCCGGDPSKCAPVPVASRRRRAG